MPNHILAKAQKIHFIGIGGIGISAVARMLKLQGKDVTGQDLNDSKPVLELRKAGIKIIIGQSLDNIPTDADLIVYTVALENYDPALLLKLKQQKIPILSYPQTLDFISRDKYTIAVSGTHGKTTTTAMIAKVLVDLGLDPTVIVGSLLRDAKSPEDSSNFILGQSKYLVVEADEYKKSFHNLHPSIMVITNLDLDHLDFYKDLSDIQNSFLHLAKTIPADGFLICDTKLPNLAPIIEGVNCRVIDYRSINLTAKLLVPGEHSRLDAKAALAVAKALELDLDKANKSLSGFVGTWRRFEYKGKTKTGALVYDDYAHNPGKISSSIDACRSGFNSAQLFVVYQPHRYYRLRTMFEETISAFGHADAVLVLPV